MILLSPLSPPHLHPSFQYSSSCLASLPLFTLLFISPHQAETQILCLLYHYLMILLMRCPSHMAAQSLSEGMPTAIQITPEGQPSLVTLPTSTSSTLLTLGTQAITTSLEMASTTHSLMSSSTSLAPHIQRPFLIFSAISNILGNQCP